MGSPISNPLPQADPTLTSVLIEAIKDVCAAEGASILLLNEDGMLVFDLVSGGVGEQLRRIQLNPDECIAGEVLQSKKPQLVSNCQSAGADRVEEEFDFSTRSMVAVPLIDIDGTVFPPGTCFGVAEAVNPVEHEVFSERDLTFLQQVAPPLARAVLALRGKQQNVAEFYQHLVAVTSARSEILRMQNDDLTRTRRAFELLRARHFSDEKMLALGRMASGIAHEINNPLSVAVSNLGTLTEAAADLSEVADRLEEEEQEILEDLVPMVTDVCTELDRIKKLVNRLMFFGDRNTHRIDDVNLVEEARRVVNLFAEHQMSSKVVVETSFEDVPTVRGCRAQLRQVVIELFDNAVRAAEQREEGGRVHISVFADEKHVNVSVGDNGKGIPRSEQLRVFDPFYTTKSAWRSTGLGLAAVYGVTRSLGGFVAIDSATAEHTSNPGSLILASFPFVCSQETLTVRTTPRANRYYEDLR